MKTTNYRITLFDGYDESFCRPIVMAAAASNGKAEKHKSTLMGLKSYGDAQQLLYPTLHENISIEIIGERLLHVDKKIGDDYKTILVIERVEMMELPKETEEGDEENVILSLYGEGNYLAD